MKPTQDDVYQMVAALMTVLGGIERARRKGDASSLAVLQLVAARAPVRPSDIAQELGVHQSTVTRQVQTLAGRGFVDAAADAEDRRACFLTLTAAGRAEVDRLTEIGLARFAAFVADWEAEDVQTLARLLTKLETSKAQVNVREQKPAGRSWQQKSKPSEEK